jgi:hypothetical protein
MSARSHLRFFAASLRCRGLRAPGAAAPAAHTVRLTVVGADMRIIVLGSILSIVQRQLSSGNGCQQVCLMCFESDQLSQSTNAQETIHRLSRQDPNVKRAQLRQALVCAVQGRVQAWV